MRPACNRTTAGPPRRRWAGWLFTAAVLLPLCTCVNPNDLGMFDLTIFVLSPANDEVYQPPDTILVRWSDLGPRSSDNKSPRWDDPPPGSTVQVLVSPTDSDDPADDLLVYGPADAIPDGDADTFEFAGVDVAGLPVPLGEYEFLVQLDDGQTMVERNATGVMSRPFRFLSPLTDHDLNTDGDLMIEWEDDALNLGTLTITLLLDSDAENQVDEGEEDETAVELLRNRSLDLDGVGEDDFLWAGRDADGQYVPQGAYDLVAHLQNAAGTEDYFIRAPGRITMPFREIPFMEITYPPYVEAGDPVDVFIDEPFTITWIDRDGDNNAIINLKTFNTFREDFIAEGLSEDADGANGSFTWTGGRNTAGELIDSGFYFLVGTIEDYENGPIEVQGARLALRPRTPAGNIGPLVLLISPRDALQLLNGDTITITWDDYDPDSNALVSLFYEDEGEVRTPIVEGIPEDPDGDSADSFHWTLAGVPKGEYTLVVTISDGFNEDENRSPNTFTVGEAADEPPTLDITEPADDVDLSYGDTLLITFDAEDPESQAIITLGIDVNSNHQSNDEIIIATNLLEGTDTQFLWDLTDINGDPVDTRQDYILYGVINDGVNSLVFANAVGRVTIRQAEGAPLIHMTKPTNATIQAGSLVQVSWEADVGSGGALVDLYIDNDDDPNDDLGTQIASGIDPDVFSTYTWIVEQQQLDDTLGEDEDRIWVHGVITNVDGEDRDTAPGRLTVTTP